MIHNQSSSSTNAMAVGFSNCSNNQISLGAKVAILVLEGGSRRYAAFINNSNADITLSLGPQDKAKINQGIILKPFGGSFEISQNNLYQGPVSAISEQKCNLSFVECSE
jgi:hypothetical protein